MVQSVGRRSDRVRGRARHRRSVADPATARPGCRAWRTCGTCWSRTIDPTTRDKPFGLDRLAELTTAELLEPLGVARTVGFTAYEQLDTKISTRGYRQISQINRLPMALGVRLIEHFGSLQGLFGASSAELQEVDGVGEQRARVIRDGLVRLAEGAPTTNR